MMSLLAALAAFALPDLDRITSRVAAQCAPACPVYAVLVEEDETNAWTDGKGVAVTRGMIERARSEDEVAFIIAHEIGHYYPSDTDDEFVADARAKAMIAAAGYDSRAGISFLRHTKPPFMSFLGGHPSNKRRIAAMEGT